MNFILRRASQNEWLIEEYLGTFSTIQQKKEKFKCEREFTSKRSLFAYINKMYYPNLDITELNKKFDFPKCNFNWSIEHKLNDSDLLSLEIDQKQRELTFLQKKVLDSMRYTKNESYYVNKIKNSEEYHELVELMTPNSSSMKKINPDGPNTLDNLTQVVTEPWYGINKWLDQDLSIEKIKNLTDRLTGSLNEIEKYLFKIMDYRDKINFTQGVHRKKQENPSERSTALPEDPKSKKSSMHNHAPERQAPKKSKQEGMKINPPRITGRPKGSPMNDDQHEEFRRLLKNKFNRQYYDVERFYVLNKIHKEAFNILLQGCNPDKCGKSLIERPMPL